MYKKQKAVVLWKLQQWQYLYWHVHYSQALSSRIVSAHPPNSPVGGAPLSLYPDEIVLEDRWNFQRRRHVRRASRQRELCEWRHKTWRSPDCGDRGSEEFPHAEWGLRTIPHFGLLQMMLPWALGYTSWCEHMFSFLLGVCLESGIAGSHSCDEPSGTRLFPKQQHNFTFATGFLALQFLIDFDQWETGRHITLETSEGGAEWGWGIYFLQGCHKQLHPTTEGQSSGQWPTKSCWGVSTKQWAPGSAHISIPWLFLKNWGKMYTT